MKINASDLPVFDILIGDSLVKPFLSLENVKGLTNHDKGQTLKTILLAISDDGYDVDYRVLNSADYGVPQMRERIYLVGVKKG